MQLLKFTYPSVKTRYKTISPHRTVPNLQIFRSPQWKKKTRNLAVKITETVHFRWTWVPIAMVQWELVEIHLQTSRILVLGGVDYPHGLLFDGRMGWLDPGNKRNFFRWIFFGGKFVSFVLGFRFKVFLLMTWVIMGLGRDGDSVFQRRCCLGEVYGHSISCNQWNIAPDLLTTSPYQHI